MCLVLQGHCNTEVITARRVAAYAKCTHNTLLLLTSAIHLTVNTSLLANIVFAKLMPTYYAVFADGLL